MSVPFVRIDRLEQGTSLRTCALLVAAFSILCALSSAQVSYKITPATLQVKASAFVGVTSTSQPISVTNTGTTNLTITSFSISPSQFWLNYGYAPITLRPGQVANFAVVFVPTTASVVTGQFTLTISGVTDPIVLTLTGTGKTTLALPQLSTTAINFGSLPVGAVSAPQTVTVMNKGKNNIAISSIAADPPFTISGAQLITLKPNQSTSFQVTFNSIGVNTYNSTLVVQYSGFPAAGINLTGTGFPAPSLAVSNYPILPASTQSAAYNAVLTATAGVGNLSWSLAQGSVLPLGLTLSADGTITGTLDPSVAVGNYPFTVSVTDSNVPPSTATLAVTLPVMKPTGSNCNQISWPPAVGQPRLIPMTDLGAGFYLGAQGGLYPGGSNTRPVDHDADGVAIAQGIQPLDANGNPDPNGKYALMSLGNSVAFDDFVQFITEANADPMKNPRLVLVPGAQPKAGAGEYAVPTSPFWSAIQNYYLPQSGVTANQVVAAWIMDVIAQPTGNFPSDMYGLQADYEKIAQNLHTFFPNLKLLYFTSRYYGGYSFGVRDPANVEAYAYQSGFAVKWAIQDQLNGLPSLNYNAALGPVMAPWMSWAHYDWANGLIPRSDGLVWTCQDIQGDGTHPSNPYGRMKDTAMMLNFFKTDSTTAPWFLAPASK